MLDNCIKEIFDALNEIVWRDDKQAVGLSVRKRYSTVARAVVEVTVL
ncbi:MAG: RusA family crossover junction endodeoxyribonuclease [Nitrosospira sp.]